MPKPQDTTPNKRRRLDAQEGPQSAVSALAARRRLGTSTPSCDTSESLDDEPKSRTGNAFSVLQALRKNESVAAKPPASPKTPVLRRDGSEQRSGDKKVSSVDSKSASARVIPYSSFKLTKQNCRTKATGVTELRLSEGERFIVLGSYGIRIRAGEVTILGATLQPSDTIHWVHSPHCHALPVARTSDKTHLELHSDDSPKPLRALANLSPLYQRIWNEPEEDKDDSASPSSFTFKILCTSEDAPKKSVIQELTSPPEWNKKLTTLIEDIQDAERNSLSMLVCGPKSAGKSTFSKLLTNRLLTANLASQGKAVAGVAVLDLDPGQPEYSPAGILSLVHVTQPNFGTPFTHPGFQQQGNKVIRSHALAASTPAPAPQLFLECAMDLYDTYRRNLRNTPLLINTPGWILGTGLDLLDSLIARINPAEVIYMSEEGPLDVVEVLQKSTKKTFTALPSQQPEFMTRTAAHLRAMQTMSYFHLAGTDVDTKARNTDAMLKWDSRPLAAITPWEISYSGDGSGILGILSYDFQSPAELFADTINGMVLAAVEIEDRRAFRDLIDASSISDSTHCSFSDIKGELSPEGLPMIPNANDIALDPQYSRTIGLVLVRGIDVERKRLQIITPIALKQIEEIRAQGHPLVLVHGKFDAPTWAYTESLYTRTGKQQPQGQPPRDMEVTDENTSEDDSDLEPENAKGVGDVATVPWVEVLKGNQKRPVGSRVWRVRRDLGRNTGD